MRHNHDLRKLLAEITEKSIIVIEDIDCSLDLTGERRRARRRGQRSPSPDYAGDDHEKPSKVTLSGLLNFIDGLWSASGSERAHRDGEAAKSAGEKKGRRRRGRKKKKQEKAEVTPEADAKAATAAAAPAPEMKQEMAEVTSEADSETV
nr:unnamed protein product [Digitaria exilis]